MKVAFTVWENRISPVLDTARTFLIAEIEEGALVSTREERLPGGTVQDLLVFLERIGVETLVCGAVSRRFGTWLTASGLKLIPFISGDVNAVVEAFLEDKLSDPAFAMPGCGRGGMGRGLGRGRGHGRGGGRGRGQGRGSACFQQPDFPEPCPDCTETVEES